MKYKQKARYLSILVGVLALVYAAALIFDPEQVQSRAAAYAWIDPRWLPQADRLEISGPGGAVSLVRRNNLWAVEKEGAEYPAKNLRVEDFLKVLSARAPYPVRSSSAAAPARLGLTEGTASRVLIRGGPGQPLLDLLAGGGGRRGERDIPPQKRPKRGPVRGGPFFGLPQREPEFLVRPETVPAPPFGPEPRPRGGAAFYD
jgi:hypothetical protein